MLFAGLEPQKICRFKFGVEMYSTSEVVFFNFHSKHHYTRPMAADWEPGLKVLRVGE